MISTKRHALLLGLTLILAACAKHPTGTVQPTAASTAANTSVPAPAAMQAAPASSMAVVPSTIKRLNEDGSETVENTTGDTGAHNPLYTAVAAVSGTASAAGLSAPSLWQEGVNYTRLVPAQPTAVAPGQVEVLEFFWYACPHCYALDPLVEAWRKTKAPYIAFSRVPIMWNAGHRSLARLYYTLEVLGKLDALHGEVFKEIHVNNDPLVGTDDASSEKMQLAFVEKHGISAQAFKSAYHSFTVETDLQRAADLMNRYRITGVPTFVVNGKYVADVGTAQGEQKLMDLVSDLAAMEHKH